MHMVNPRLKPCMIARDTVAQITAEQPVNNDIERTAYVADSPAVPGTARTWHPLARSTR